MGGDDFRCNMFDIKELQGWQQMVIPVVAVEVNFFNKQAVSASGVNNKITPLNVRNCHQPLNLCEILVASLQLQFSGACLDGGAGARARPSLIKKCVPPTHRSKVHVY